MLRRSTLVTIFISGLVLLSLALIIHQNQKQIIRPADLTPVETTWWRFQSVDTMKYSRDLAREKLNKREFDSVIDTQVKNIAEIGATHVAIATPYDAEFLPFLKKWVAAARKYGLNVWYRGNWSGWEGWFDYERINRETHIEKSVNFIKENPDLFRSGDIFSACPECENGGPGDPRLNGDSYGHRKFLIDEYKAVSEIFRNMGKNVQSNFSPMNGDVAKFIMDPATTRALGGVVVVDHYVSEGVELARDLQNLAEYSQGKIVLGEFGAPIPDIHKEFTSQEQAEWIEDALSNIARVDSIIGINYWVNMGGSTKIWNDDGTPRESVSIISSYFKPKVVSGLVYNEINEPIANAQVVYNTNYYKTDKSGRFVIKDNQIMGKAVISSNNYVEKEILLDEEHPNLTIILAKNNESLWFKFRKLLYNLR